MRKLIAGINLTLDGFCDHTAGIADDELHEHYTELLRNSDTILYGRITYQLMEYWPPIVKNPTGNASIDEFAVAMNDIQKIVFSHTLTAVEMKNTKLSKKDLREEVLELRQQPGKDILVGSRSLINSLMNLNLIDEFQFTVQPIVLGKGLPLFNNIENRIDLQLVKTKIFKSSGSVTLYYEPRK